MSRQTSGSLVEHTPADLRAEILRALDEVKDPCSVTAGDSLGLTEMGLVRSVDVSSEGAVTVTLRLTSPFCEMIGFLKTSALDGLQALPGVSSVTVEADSGFDWSTEHMSPQVRERREERLRAIRADVEARRRLPLVQRDRQEPLP